MITPSIPTSTLLNQSSIEQAPRSSQPSTEIAQEFESLFISLMMKEMRQAGSENGLFPGDTSDTFGGMFDMYMGQFLAENGGIGLSSSISEGMNAALR